MQKKSATFFSGPQLWKLDGNMLQNQEGLWKSNDLWNFVFKEDLICIEKFNKTGVFFERNNVRS